METKGGIFKKRLHCNKKRPMGKVWTAEVLLTSRLPVGSQWLWPWIPCWSFIFPLHSWALGLYFIYHLCNRKCCLSMCFKIIAKFRKKKNKTMTWCEYTWAGELGGGLEISAPFLGGVAGHDGCAANTHSLFWFLLHHLSGFPVVRRVS